MREMLEENGRKKGRSDSVGVSRRKEGRRLNFMTAFDDKIGCCVKKRL